MVSMIKLLVKLSPKLTGNQIIYRIECVVLGSRRVWETKCDQCSLVSSAFICLQNRDKFRQELACLLTEYKRNRENLEIPAIEDSPYLTVSHFQLIKYIIENYLNGQKPIIFQPPKDHIRAKASTVLLKPQIQLKLSTQQESRKMNVLPEGRASSLLEQ